MRVDDVASRICQALDLGEEEPLGSFVTTAEPGAEATDATDATVTPPMTLEQEAGDGGAAGAVDVNDGAAPVSHPDLEARLTAASNAAKLLRDEADGRTSPVPFPAPPDCLLVVYQCTRTRSPHPPPWPGHSFSFPAQPDCLLVVCQCHRVAKYVVCDC